MYLFSFVETPRKFIIAKLSIRELGSSSVLIILALHDGDPSLRIERFAIINLRGVSTKLNKYIVFTMQAYQELKAYMVTLSLDSSKVFQGSSIQATLEKAAEGY